MEKSIDIYFNEWYDVIKIKIEQQIDYKQGVEIMKNIQKTLKDIRSNYHLTQKQAAELLNMPVRTFENWESGSREPSDWMFEIVCETLNARARKQFIEQLGEGIEDEAVVNRLNEQEDSTKYIVNLVKKDINLANKKKEVLENELEKLNKNRENKWEIESVNEKFGMLTALIETTTFEPTAVAGDGTFAGRELKKEKEITVYNDLSVEILNI